MRPLLPALVLLSACSATGTRASESTIVVGRPADAIGLDPARVTDGESAEVCEQIFEHLVRFRHGSTEIEPALAESWTVSAQGTEWTFRLRRGVRFHDGSRLDADAVVFSFDRQRDARHPFHRGDFTYWESTFRNIVRVEKVDPLAVRIVIERPYAPFLANLAMFPVSIVSPTAVARWGEEFARHPVGTGPFRFVEWVPGERITLTANREYWGGAPQVANLVFVAIHDARQRLVALEGGAIDVAEGLAPQDVQFINLHPELRTERLAGNNVSYLAMNTQRPPFDDVRVRRAINYAIHKAPIVKLVYQGLAVPATGPLAPSVWGHVDLPPYPYDPEQARRLLVEAKYDHRLRPKLYVMSTSRRYLPAPEQVARIIVSNLHDVGIDVELIVNPMDAHLRATSNGEHDLCLRGWSGDNGDPDNFLYRLLDSDNAEPGTASNISFFRNLALHGLLRWAQESPNRSERAQYYAKAQQIVHDEAPWVPLAHSEVVVAMRRKVVGFAIEPSATLSFRGVRFEEGRR